MSTLYHDRAKCTFLDQIHISSFCVTLLVLRALTHSFPSSWKRFFVYDLNALILYPFNLPRIERVGLRCFCPLVRWSKWPLAKMDTQEGDERRLHSPRLLAHTSHFRSFLHLRWLLHSGPLVTPGLTLMTLPNPTIQCCTKRNSA